MANAVDERIVAAKFDSSDFEKGVDKTIKKLDELEEKLDMKDIGKGLEESSKKTQKATESLSKSIENLENRFTSFMGLIKQKTLESLADAVVNSFWKMEKATLGFFRSMTTGQISAGMDKYESMLTSVRMITNSTYFANDADKKAGKKTYYKQEDAYASMEKLQKYADETSYSMEQMTDAMSKMVAAGVSLKQAERNVQGIASACANAGVNATDASRAFFNLSQAYSTGALKYTDYRSLELLNLTNEAFQDQLLAAGVAAGVLEEKTDKNGNKSYKTKKTDRNGKVTAGKKFTRQGLGESLKYNWADKDVMDALFGGQYYVDVADFEDAKEDPVTKRQRTTEERIEYLSKLVDESKMAAKATDKEVEEVLKNLDEKDSRKTEYASLKTEKERKAYLKKMREEEDVQAKLIDKETEKIVESLDDTDKRKQDLAKITDPEERSKRLAELRQEDDIMAKLPKKYSEVAIKAFMAAREARNFNDVIKAVADFVSSKFSKVFEILFGKLDEAAEFFTALSEGGIAGIFTGFAEYLENVFKEFDSNGGGMGGKAFRDLLLEIDSAVGMLSDTFSSFMPGAESLGDWLYKFIADLSVTVQHMQIYIAQFQGWLAQTDGSMTRLEKIRAILGNIFGVFGAIGKAIGVAFDAIRKGLDLLTPVFDLVINLVTELTKPIGQLGSREYTAPFDKISNAINNVYQVLKPVSDLLSPFISKLGTILGQVGAFFLQGSIDAFVMNFEFVGDLIKFIVDLFGPDDMKAVMKGNDVLGDIVNTIDAFKKVCSDAFGAVKQFFGTLISDLRKFAGLEESGEGEGVFSGIKNFFDTNEFINNAKAWFEQAKKDIVAWFKGLPQKIGDFFNDLLYDKELVSYMDKGNVKSKYVTVDSPLKQRIDAIIEATKTFLKELPGKIKAKATQFAKSFKNTIHGLFYTKVFDVDEKGNKKQVEIATPLKRWIDRVATGLINAIKTFILNIPEYIKTGIKAVGSAGRFIAEGIRGLFNHEDAEKALEDETNKITLSGVISALGDIAATLFNEIISLFTNTDDMQKNFEWVGQKILGFITSIPSLIGKGIEGITFGFGTIWEWIYDKIVGTSSDGKDSELMKFIDENFGENASDDSFIGKIKKIPDLLRSAVEDIKAMFSSLWESILGINIGTKTERRFKGLTDAHNPLFEYVEVPKTFGDKLEEIKGTISKFISNLPTNITKTWEDVQSSFSDAWEKVLGIQVETKIVDGKEVPVTLGDKIEEYRAAVTAFINDIPGHITSAWDSARTLISDAWNKVLSIQIGTKTERRFKGLSDEHNPLFEYVEVPETLGDKFEEIKKTIGDFITNLPENIIAIWKNAKASFSDAWNKVLSIQIGTKTERRFKGLSDEHNPLFEYVEVPETLGDKFEEIKKTIINFIINLPQNMQDAWDGINTDLGNFWTNLVNVFTGEDGSKSEGEKTFGDRLTDFLANIPKYLADGLNSAVDGITSVFDFINEAISDSLSGKDGATGNLATDLENNTSEAIANGAEGLKKEDANSPRNQFLKAITEFGSSIWNLITVTIPTTIRNAFNWIRDRWDDPKDGWRVSLLSIFDKAKEKLGIADFDLSEIGTTIKNAILNLPETIRKGLDDAGDLIGGLLEKKKLPKDGAVEFFDEAGESIEKGAGESDFWSDVMSLAGEISTAISGAVNVLIENVGPLALQFYTGFIEKIKMIAELISSWFRGNLDDKNAEKIVGVKGIGETIASIGATLKTLITETIPKFIADAFVFILHEVPDMITNFIKEFKSASEEQVKKANANNDIGSGEATLEAASGLLDLFTSVIGQLMGSFEGIKNFFFDENNQLTTQGYIVGAIAIIIMILKAIGDLRSSGVDKQEARAENSFYKVLKWFMIFLTSVVMLIGILTQVDTERLNAIMGPGGVFEKITEFIYHLMDFIAIIVIIKNLPDIIGSLISGGEAIGKLFGGIKKLFKRDKGSGTSIDEIVKGMTFSEDEKEDAEDSVEEDKNFIEQLMESIIGTVEGVGGATVAEAWGTAANSIFTQILGNIDIIDDAFAGFTDQLGKALDNVIAVKDKIGDALGVVGQVLSLITELVKIGQQRDNVTLSTSTIYGLNGALLALALPFTGDIHAAEIVKALQDIMGLTGEMTTFVNEYASGDSFNAFKQAMSGLGAALSTFNFVNIENINDLTTEQIDSIAKTMMQLLNNKDLMDLIKQVGTDFIGDSNFSKGADNLILFSNAFSKLASGVTSIDEKARNNLSEFFTGLSEIALTTTFKSNNGEETLVTFSGQMMGLGQGISTFCETLRGIKTVDFDTPERALNMVVDVAKRMSTIGVGVLEKAIAGGTELRDFGPILSGFAPHIKSFITGIQPTGAEESIDNLDYSYIVQAMYALDRVVKAAGSLQYSGNGVENLKKLLTAVDEDGNSISTLLVKFVMGFFDSISSITYALTNNGQSVKIKEITLKENEITKYIDQVQVLLNSFGYFFEALSKLSEMDVGKVVHDLSDKQYDRYDRQWKGSGIEYIVMTVIDAFDMITKMMTGVEDETVGARNISIDDVNDFLDLMSYYFEILNKIAYFATETRVSYDSKGNKIINTAYSNFTNSEDVFAFVVSTIETVKNHVGDIFGMVDALAKYDNDGDKIDKAKNVLSVIKDLGTALMLFGAGVDVTGGFSQHYEYFNDFTEGGLASFQAFADNIDIFTSNMSTVVDRLSAFYEEEENAEKLKKSGNIMASKLFLGIQEAFNTDTSLQPVITPVLNDTTLRQQMGELFGLENPSDFNFGSGFSDAVSSAFSSVSRSDAVTAETFTLKLDEIGGKLDNMDTNFRTSIDSIATSFNGAKLIVDREAFVMSIGPYVDAYLSNIGYLHINHNATGNQ